MGSYTEIDQLNQRLDELRPLKKNDLASLQKHYFVERVYHSNAIEGNTLTLLETALVLEKGITIGGKPLKDHLEAVNLAEAMEYMEDVVKTGDLSDKLIRDFHFIICNHEKHKGTYKQYANRIVGSEMVPASPFETPYRMEALFDWYEENKSTLHPVELGAVFHQDFVNIHPFQDGNGRTARLSLDFILMKNGYPPAMIRVSDEKLREYYSSLEHYHSTRDRTPFITFITSSVRDSLNNYLHAIRS
ncbi:Fic family protein [Paenibacillus sp. GCM10023252]|uniref:Fic family protein n=1 Tax=Paenibacillus sp. GCM10023252 TaxID=3252649 RepID=UPI00361FF2EE